MNPWLRRALLAAIGIELALLVAQQYAATQRAAAPEPARSRSEEPQGIEAVALTAYPDRIADAAGVLGGFRHTIEWQGQSWRDDLGIEIQVVTLRSPAAKIASLANQIFQERRIGEGAPSGGVLVLLNSLRGEARIEVSYSLEHVFPDLIVGRIARDQLAPYAAYRVAGMAVMDVLHLLKDYAYLQAVRGALELPSAYRERPEFVEKARYLSGGAGARATLAMAAQEDRDLKAPVPAERRARYAPSGEPLKSAEAYLRTLTDQVGDPTLDLYTPGSRCMLEAYPYAPFEQLERLERAEDSKPLRVRLQGDHAVVDSDRPAHGFVPFLLERRGGRWRIDLVETWKNLFFDSKGDYHQKNNNHPYTFALDRFGAGGRYGVEPWQLATDLVTVRRMLVQRGRAFDEYLLAELLYRNCWLAIDALSHYERAIELSPHNWLFNETLAGRAAYVGFYDLAASAYAELGSAGLLWLAHVQQAAADGDAAIATARRALERDPYWIEAHDLVRALLEAKGDRSGARAEQQRIDAIRADPRRPGAALAITFDPPYPVLHGDAPTKVGDTDVYDHSYFAVTLANPSGRDVEIESAILISDGTADRSGLGDIKDYWRYPAGSHRLRAGESASFARTWGFTVKTGHQQLRYAFDVCWKADDERQCRDYRVDLFPPFDEIGLVNPEAAAVRVPTEDDGARRAHPAIAARLELLALLRGRRFDELTRRVEAAQAAFEADPGREEQVAQMWDTFASSDPALTLALDAWVASSDSYAPRTALGIHHRRRGWNARRDREQHFAQARQSLARAVELHPRLAIAFENLLNVVKYGASEDDGARFAEQAARVCPSCIGPPYERLIGLTPRWGGSYEQMERYLAELAPRIEKFPRLAVLRGAIADDQATTASSRSDYRESVRLHDDALRHGDYWRYRRYRGDALYRLERYDEALADHEFWLDHGARGAEALLAKAYDLGALRRYAEAAEVIDLAQRLEPTDDEIIRLAAYYRGRR